MFFVNGTREGQFKQWYENGKIKRFCLYRHGNIIGRAIEYDING